MPWLYLISPYLLFFLCMISGNHSFSLNVRRISCFESKLRQYSYTRQPIPDVVKKICLNECKIPSKLPYLALMSISGGVDSMAMLHIMKSVQRNHFPSLALEVIHFNHKKREQSEEEVDIFWDFFVLKVYFLYRKNLYDNGVRIMKYRVMFLPLIKQNIFPILVFKNMLEIGEDQLQK